MIARKVERWNWVPRAASLAALALLLLGLFVITQTSAQDREQKSNEIRVQAQILAANVTAALDFRDTAALREAVTALRANPRIRLAGVYDASGALVASYQRVGETSPVATTPRRDTTDNGIVAIEPVMRATTRLGSVRVVADGDDPYRRIARYGMIALLVVMATLIVGILGLAQAALRGANRELIDANHELTRQIEGREEAETQLRQAQKMDAIGQLTGGIAHDFNNMLAIVIGNLDIARRRLATKPDRALVGIEHAMEGATRAAALTQRLLAFARQQPLQPQIVDVGALVGGMSDLLHRTIGEHLRVNTMLDAGLWRTHADPSQLENAILNLCVNARDAMADGGDLTIAASNHDTAASDGADHEGLAPGQYVVIAVTDSGPGMPPDVRDRAFEPFFTTKGAGKGTGLGLSQVFGFINQSGGRVRIDTEVGRGTSVILYLPRTLGVQAMPSPGGDAAIDLPRARPGETVLAVEDEDHVRRMTTLSLDELGYTVIEATDGDTALQQLRAHPNIGLLFTDMVMPGVNGRQLADQAHAMRPDLGILFTTGYAPEPEALVAMPYEAGVLHKPFTLQKLADELRRGFDRRAGSSPAA